MKNIKFVFAVSFCALFVASAALATAPDFNTPGEYDEEYNKDISAPHDDIFDILDKTAEDGAGQGIAGVTYVNRAVNSAGAAAMAAEAHAAAAGAYAVSAKSSADAAQEAAEDANKALGDKADKSEIKNATLTIQRNGTDVGTFTANASDPKTINIVDNDTIYTLPTATADTLGGVMVDTALSSSSTNPVQNKVVNEALDGKADKSEIKNATLTIQRNGTDVGTFTANAGEDATLNIVDEDTIYTLPTASTSTLGGVKVGTNLSIDDNGVLSAKDTTYSAGTNITISEDGKINAKDTTYSAGTNITISEDGTISATDTVYTLPTASTSTLGGVKVGTNLSIDDNGVLSAKDTTYSAGTNITITDGVISATVPTGALASKDVVVSEDIKDGEVKTADIANSAVITEKIADGAVTAAKTTGIIGKVPSGSENSTTLTSIWLQ